jgi:hypothetical protein
LEALDQLGRKDPKVHRVLQVQLVRPVRRVPRALLV